MYERSYGSKYVLGAPYQSAAAIAKLMRADIKAAVGNGDLPKGNYSVRVHNYSGGRSIHIEMRDAPDLWVQCEGHYRDERGDLWNCNNRWCAGHAEMADSPHAEVHQRLGVEGARIKKVLQGIHDSYNYDGSEVMVDYFDRNFYGGVEIEDARSRDFRLREKARMAARKAARKAA